MKLKSVRLLAISLFATLLAACGESADKAATSSVVAAQPQQTFEWKMVTTWPKNFPGLGAGANRYAELVNEMSGGRLEVKVYGAKELVGALEVFDAVSRGTAELGHGGAYYWKGKAAAAQFFSAVPFGMTAQEMNGWLYHGGGLELWQEVYEPFGLVPLAVGNSGTQMGGWFNKEINTIADLEGLKMRLPGLGGEVLRRAGGVPVLLPGGEIFPSLQTGTIDATEWVGPYNDLAFGLHKAAKYYYYPGWHEPGTTMELIVNKEALESLPADLQSIVKNAAKVANLEMLADFTARNNKALKSLVEEHGVELRKFPDEVLLKLRELSEQVIADEVANDPLSAKVYESFKAFNDQVVEYHRISEQAYLNARTHAKTME